MRPAETIASMLSSARARRSETWIVTGITRSIGAASIITSRPAAPVSTARNSVWPGWGKPARVRTALLIGLVTTASTSPERASDTARSMLAMMPGALALFGAPAVTGACKATGSTGIAPANTACA